MEEYILEIIEKANTFGDLFRISEVLIPLNDLKTFLKEHIKQLSLSHSQSNEYPPPKNQENLQFNRSPLSLILQKVYFTTSSFHEIFPDAIQAKIVGFIGTTQTHQQFPCISKSFKQLFIDFPALYDDVKHMKNYIFLYIGASPRMRIFALYFIHCIQYNVILFADALRCARQDPRDFKSLAFITIDHNQKQVTIRGYPPYDTPSIDDNNSHRLEKVSFPWYGMKKWSLQALGWMREEDQIGTKPIQIDMLHHHGASGHRPVHAHVISQYTVVECTILFCTNCTLNDR